jgi:glycosyltransferase involved in cell wall biosynthesis
MDKLPISLCVITLNEEANLKRCLSSVPFASDIVVLDSGSIDATTTIAQEMGARVFIEPWRGFGPQKRRAVELAKFDWVICLDV